MKGGLRGRRSTPCTAMKVLIKNRQRLIKINLRTIKKDSLRLLTSFNLDRAELGILFVNEKQMKHLNLVHRNVDRATDVLSFPQFDSMKEFPHDVDFLLGDIVIDPRAARRQAALYGLTPAGELRRLLIHGFLHLLGFDHERSRYGAGKMRKHERMLRDALEKMD